MEELIIRIKAKTGYHNGEEDYEFCPTYCMEIKDENGKVLYAENTEDWRVGHDHEKIDDAKKESGLLLAGCPLMLARAINETIGE